MTANVLVAADVRLEHLLTAATEDVLWHGWTVGGPAVRAAVQQSGAVVVVGGDEVGARALKLLEPANVRPLIGKGRTPQTFRVMRPSLSLQAARRTTSRCPVCSFIHGLDRHSRPRLTGVAADLVVTDSLRSDVLHSLRHRPPRYGTVAVLEDPSLLRFASIGEIANNLRSVDALVASSQVAATLRRRLKLDDEPLDAALDITVRVVGRTAREIRDRRGDAWSEFEAVDAMESAVRDTLNERLPAPLWVSQRYAGALRFPEPVRLSELHEQHGRCPLCGSSTAKPRTTVALGDRRPPVGASHNLGWLRRRALRAADTTEAMAAAERLLSWSGSAYVVASGGSAVAAAYITQLLRERTQLFATEAFPSDYSANGARTDALVLVSYSGSTPDHVPVLRRARQLGVERIALICHSPHPRLLDELGPSGLLIAYGNPRHEARAERGFVSMAATVAPCALMLAAVDGAASLAPLASSGRDRSDDLGRRLGDALRDNYELHVLGSGYARPAMLDLESKWVEGDLGPITIHQSKDFSHGRFMSLLGSGRPAVPLMLSVGADQYEQELVSTLLDEHRASDGLVDRPHHLTSDHGGLLGALELLIDVQEIATAAGRAVGKDLSRPERIDPGGLRLYSWRKSFPEPPADGLLPSWRDRPS